MRFRYRVLYLLAVVLCLNTITIFAQAKLRSEQELLLNAKDMGGSGMPNLACSYIGVYILFMAKAKAPCLTNKLMQMNMLNRLINLTQISLMRIPGQQLQKLPG